jgi:hypothetical protein
VPTLHITNGDCAAGTLRTFLADPVYVTCDVLHDGPAPAVDGDEWHDVRARFLAGRVEAPYDDIRRSLAAFDRRIGGAENGDEIVLWFEHDLFDQLLLIRTLDVLSRPKKGLVSLICIDRFPGVERFIGLGQLSADQLASLYPNRRPVTEGQFAVAHEAWRAFRASEPSELLSLARRSSGRTEVLPFLRRAIRRLLEEYPSTTTGLSRTAEAILRAIESRPLDALTVFQTIQAEEPCPFMGDWGLFDVIHEMADARVPLVTISPSTAAVDLRGHTIDVTRAGRDVLTGRSDAVALNGIDTWRGGVHLVGRDRSPWRWDPGGETLVS